MEAITYVYLAGIDNSGPDHWQAMWHARSDNGVWVEHEAWEAPVRDVWVKDLDDVLRSIEGPKVLIAHSLGCTVLTEWATEHQDEGVVGALVVAMPDVHGSNFPKAALGFDVPRHGTLPFLTVVVASEDDPFGYSTPVDRQAVAERLGAQLVEVGRKGHINASSGLGDWSEGWSIFGEHFLG
ncbi:alpha/beta hydrolase [Streptomyces sp. ISL-100]|uniref:RBBP9/YdeN family alpha/beta hydrolase n=1 Tax=Streptomyces sp. ISL-100 TaxID=2819173 RepID=UPI001BE64FC0|nr:alpha/beta hydrolase [Streptomyces sp. ISL-100]MBT2401567.1 alpha/beta hydrolase [Streptomyces sp. ISL-100]